MNKPARKGYTCWIPLHASADPDPKLPLLFARLEGSVVTKQFGPTRAWAPHFHGTISRIFTHYARPRHNERDHNDHPTAKAEPGSAG